MLSDTSGECEVGQLSIIRAFSSSLRPDVLVDMANIFPEGDIIDLFIAPSIFFSISNCFLFQAVGQKFIKLRKSIKNLENLITSFLYSTLYMCIIVFHLTQVSCLTQSLLFLKLQFNLCQQH